MAESAVNVNFPAPSPYEHRVSTVGPSTGEDVAEDVVTPRQEAAQTALAHQTEDEAAFARRKQTQAEQVAGAEAQGAEAAQFVEQGLQALRTGPEAQKAGEYIQMARHRLRSEQDRLNKMPAPALFADRDGWGKVRLGVGMALAGLGDGMMAAAAIRAGHAPMRGNSVQQIIENDLDRQRAAISKQKDSVVMARAGVDDAKEARNILLGDIELKGKAMYRQLELLQRSRLASLKLDQPSIDATKEILDANRAQKEQEAKFADAHGKNVKSRWDSAKTTVENINRTPSPGAGAGGVEADKNAAQFAILKEHGTWIANAMPGLSDDDIQAVNMASSLADSAKDRPLLQVVATGLGVDAETGISSRAKEFIDHMERGNKAIARLESGAAIGKVEGQDFRDKMRPRVSDKRQDREMRSNNLRDDIQSWGAHVERGPRSAPSAAPSTPAAPPEFTPARVQEAKRIAQDKNEPRKKRDRAREYISAAAAAGVK